MDLTWIKQHKWVVALFGAAAGGFVLYSYINRGSSSSGTASSLVSGTAGGPLGAPQYLVPVVQDGTSPSPTPASTSTTPVSNVPVPTTTHKPKPPPKTTSAAAVAINPYSVGTKVTSNESITQSVYDPLYGSWVDLTSKGGIYTSPGTAVSGSGYNPAWNGSGRLSLVQGGAAVAEYDPSGKLVGTYKIGK